MSYFIFLKNSPNINGTLYRIAANDTDLNNLNIDKSSYNIITDTNVNFQSVQLRTIDPVSYDNNNVINYQPLQITFSQKNILDDYIKNYYNLIDYFIQSNPSSPVLSIWQTYQTQLITTNTSIITYPLNMSLEQYYQSKNLTFLNPLQIP